MSNGSYGNGPSQARLIIAAAAGILAFLLTKFAWHHGFWWALLIGVVVFGIVIALWSMLGGSSDAGYAGTRSVGGSAASSARGSSPPACCAAVAPPSSAAAGRDKCSLRFNGLSERLSSHPLLHFAKSEVSFLNVNTASHF